MNIYQRMAKITEELGVIAKNLNVETGTDKRTGKVRSYKAVSERDIIDAVKPLETKYGVYSFPVNREIIEGEMLEAETSYGIKTTFFSRIKTTYRFVNIDEPTDYIETVTFAEGIDSGDKGSGKAMTYSDKYALMKAYKISTGDDPDQNASEDLRYVPPGTADLEEASPEEKKKILAVCKSIGYDVKDILNMVGVPEGGKMTKKQYVKAFEILQRVSEKRASEGKE